MQQVLRECRLQETNLLAENRWKEAAETAGSGDFPGKAGETWRLSIKHEDLLILKYEDGTGVKTTCDCFAVNISLLSR